MGKEGKHTAKHVKREKVKPVKEKKPGRGKDPNKKNVFVRIKEWFLKMSKAKRAIIISLCAVILALIIAISYVLGFVIKVAKNYNHSEISDPDILSIEPIDERIINVALFGIDTRTQGSFEGLSDSIMILSINTETGDLKLISVMRDSFVKIPDHNGKSYRPNKINSAYLNGGPELAIKTLNANFGLDIKEYATVNFYGMANIVDAAFGKEGMEIEVRQAELNAKNGLNDNIREQTRIMGLNANDYLVTEAGKQKLNGIQAVAWARIRSVATTEGTANDYGRTDRQRYVMEQLLNKALSMSVTEYPALVEAILPHMQTSISLDEAVSLAVNVLGKGVNFEQTRVPQTEYLITDSYYVSYAGSCVYYDIDFVTKIIHAMIYEGMTQDEFLELNKVEKNNWHGASLGGGSSSGSGSGGGSGNTSSDSGNTGSDVTSSDTTGSDVTGSDTTGGDVTGGDATGSESTGSGVTGSDATSSDVTGGDTTGGETTGGGTSGGGTSGGGITGGDSNTSTGGDTSLQPAA